VKSRTTEQFRKAFADLPKPVWDQARAAYRKFKQDPWYSSLRFKQIHSTLPIYSVRVSKGFRALGRRDEKGMLWFWIGSHTEYEKLLSQM
jgi:hypothetical protein